jgi:hypothetical protein
MVTRYVKFEDNSEVMDVLFCVVLGNDSVERIQETLKQAQSTISTKLTFLRKKKIVKKKKWVYEVNWQTLYKIMYSVIEDFLKLRAKGIAKRVRYYFPESRLKKILIGYSILFLEENWLKQTIREIVKDYFLSLMRTDDRQLRKIDPKLLELKRKLKIQKPMEII